MIKPIKFSQDIVNDMLRRTAREAASVDDAVRDIINNVMSDGDAALFE